MNIVKELRKGVGMQQKELALAVGVAAPTVSEWEHQKKDPSGDRLKKLAEIFNVSPAVILGVGANNPSDEETEAWMIRERMRRDPNYRLLFSAAENAKPEHLRAAAAMIKALENNDE